MSVHLDERFWGASIEETKQGFLYDEAEESYCCLLCGEQFQNGEVFRAADSGRFYDAKKYAGFHVAEKHGSMLDYLLGLDKKATGLTDLQKELIQDFAAGRSDQDIVKRTGGSSSTIRNHRFVLKEKAKQAKLLLAITELMEKGVRNDPEFVPIHRTATKIDERFALTEEEYESLIEQYLPDGPEGPLDSFPSKEKRKIAVLRHISTFFKLGESYTEAEINERLKSFSDTDYVTIRRYLIEYGYLDRKNDGSEYWVPVKRKDDAAMEANKKKEAETTEAVTKTSKSSAKPDKAARKALTAEYQEKERTMGVYEIRNKTNGRIFIGGSTHLEGLWNKETFMLNLGSHQNKELQREWKEYGAEQFSYLVLETVKLENPIRYDYNDVHDEDGKELPGIAKNYKREVEKLKEKWLLELNPYGERGYH
ncbi:DUF2087 domain-containing protein [Paenibacillus sp. GCM10027627]|uniref:DUF2087 domain-containing protein n=1 Tax=unclassified Paenibacillus TaxID=185978 RepID=UPI003643F4F2